MTRCTSMYRLVGKRLFDIVLAAASLPFLLLVSVIIGPLIKLEDGGPVFFRGTRRGTLGRPFQIHKFRSMKVDSPDVRKPDGSTVNSLDDIRVTRIGRVLRKTSLDELPQVLNVLRGEMSLIGPRPNMASRSWTDLSEQERKRTAVRPGITGPAQVRGRNELSIDERLRIDEKYVDDYSFLGDLEILKHTFAAVVSQRGIHSKGHK